VTAELSHGAKDVGSLLGDFGTDAVAGENCNFETHDALPLACG
jgi:hypothetical protein